VRSDDGLVFRHLGFRLIRDDDDDDDDVCLPRIDIGGGPLIKHPLAIL